MHVGAFVLGCFVCWGAVYAEAMWEGSFLNGAVNAGGSVFFLGGPPTPRLWRTCLATHFVMGWWPVPRSA